MQSAATISTQADDGKTLEKLITVAHHWTEQEPSERAQVHAWAQIKAASSSQLAGGGVGVGAGEIGPPL